MEPFLNETMSGQRKCQVQEMLLAASITLSETYYEAGGFQGIWK